MSASDKRIHFGTSGVYLSMPGMPNTPSPSFSELSLPSTPGGLHTPQDLPHVPLPPVPSSSHPPKAYNIHSVIGYRPGVPLPLLYDVSQPPTSMGFNMLFSAQHAARVLGEPATDPPAAHMTLVSDLLPYPIHVLPGAAASIAGAPVPSPPGAANRANDGGAAFPFVTVQDVLATVYAFLRTPLTPTEYGALPAPQQATVAAAFNARIALAASSASADDHPTAARERERAKGVKRIDLLSAAGRTVFAGLGATRKGGPGVWVLNLA